jgi:hypothetical protein
MVHGTCTLWPKSEAMTSCGLFYDSVSISDYTMPNGRMTGELTGKGLE